MILVVAVALWIVWVAPYVLRNRQQFQAAGELMADVADAETADPQAGTVINMNAQQENPMDIRKSTESAEDAASPDTVRASESNAPQATGRLKIRFGRCAVALAAVVSLLTALISAVLRTFGIGNSWLPVVALLGCVGAIVLLRRLAVRDRRAKLNAAFNEAMSAPARRHDSGSGDLRLSETRDDAARTENPPFDAEAGRPTVKPLTAMELREAALAVAVASGDNSVRAPKLPATAAGTKWEPVEVPRPTYVEAAKAERPAPEPLDLPQAPKSVGKPSLKQGAAAAPPVASGQSRPLTKAQSALSNLDDVLQRRRA